MAKKPKLVHRSVHFVRTEIDDQQGKLEKSAAQVWEKKCSDKFGRFPFPHVLLAPPGTLPDTMSARIDAPSIPELSQAEATAMATVFQWVFTPIGLNTMVEAFHQAGWEVEIKSPAQVERERRRAEDKHPVTTGDLSDATLARLIMRQLWQRYDSGGVSYGRSQEGKLVEMMQDLLPLPASLNADQFTLDELIHEHSERMFCRTEELIRKGSGPPE